MAVSQLNIRPVFDVHADVQGRDLYGAAHDIDQVLAAHRPDASKALSVTLSGQVETMAAAGKTIRVFLPYGSRSPPSSPPSGGC
jgi:Cu/Ag efflux pump CusA